MRLEPQKDQFENFLHNIRTFLYLWLLIPTVIFVFQLYFLNEDDRE